MSSFADELLELTTVSFVGHDGDVQPSGYTMREIARSGVVGAAFMVTGYVGQPFQIFTRAVVNGASLAALLQILYKQYKCHLVTFTDDQANSWSHLMVLDVENIRVQRYTAGVGLAAGSTHMVTATWTLQSCAVSY